MSSEGKFTIVKNGYSTLEVKAFLKRVTVEFEKLINENKLLNEQLSSLMSNDDSLDSVKLEFDQYVKTKKKELNELENKKEIIEEMLNNYEESIKKLLEEHADIISKMRG